MVKDVVLWPQLPRHPGLQMLYWGRFGVKTTYLHIYEFVHTDTQLIICKHKLKFDWVSRRW